MTLAPLTFNKNVDTNVERIIDDAKAGKGILAKQFANSYDGVEKEILNNHKLQQSRDPSLAPLTADEVRESVNARMDKMAEEKFKPMLKQAARGDASKVDIKDMAGMAGAATSIATEGVMGKLGGVLSLMSFTPIMDLISGLMSYFAGKGFDNGKQESQFNRGIDTLAQKLEVDPNELKQELTKAPETAAAPPQTPAKPATTQPVTQPVTQPGAPDGMVVPPPLATPAGTPPAPAQGTSR